MEIALATAADSLEFEPDRDLARRCAAGDERAMREVFDAYEPRLRRLLVRNLGNREDAEEVAASTFLKFWRTAGKFRGDCSLKAYLTRIALNLSRDRLRRRRWQTSAEVLIEDESENPLADRIRQGLLQLEPDDRALSVAHAATDSSFTAVTLPAEGEL